MTTSLDRTFLKEEEPFNETAFNSLGTINRGEFDSATKYLNEYYANPFWYGVKVKNRPVRNGLQSVLTSFFGKGTRKRKIQDFYSDSVQVEISEKENVLNNLSSLSLDYLGHYLNAHNSYFSFANEEKNSLQSELTNLEENYQEDLGKLKEKYNSSSGLVNYFKKKFKLSSESERKNQEQFLSGMKLLDGEYKLKKKNLNKKMDVVQSPLGSFEKQYSKMINLFLRNEKNLSKLDFTKYVYETQMPKANMLNVIKNKDIFS